MNEQHRSIPGVVTGFEAVPRHGLPEADSPAPNSASQQPLWRVVDDRLRGRWRWMLCTGALLAAVAAPTLYVTVAPTFETTGLVRVAPKIDPILNATPENELLPFYAQFVQTQAEILASRRVIQEALDRPEVRGLDWATAPDAVHRVEASLDVEAPRNGQIIIVRYESTDAREAEIVLNAILDSYESQVADGGLSSVSGKIDTLQRRRASLNAELMRQRQGLQELPSVVRFNTVDLDALLGLKLEQLERFNQELDWIVVAEAMTPGAASGDSETPPSAVNLSGAQLDAIDPRLAELRRTRDGLLLHFEQTKRDHGPSSRVYQQAARDLEAAETLLLRHEGLVRRQFAESGGALPADLAAVAALTPEQLATKRSAIEGLRTSLSSEIQMITADRLKAESSRQDRERLESDLADVERRLVELQLEAESADRARIVVFQRATRPTMPSHDRRLALACGGAVAGFGLSLALFFALGTIDRRAYQSRQLNVECGPRCLGVLPEIDAGSNESREVAAHCVHQIRNMIEAGTPSSAPRVIAITSPFQGDGKTSISLALAMSYAAAGNRTIVIDGDLIGRGLTRQLGLLKAQGLRESLRSGHVNGECRPVPGAPKAAELEVLAVGIDPMIGPEAVRKRDLDRLFDTLRERFDVILIDTGPVLGSLECIPIAAAADAVVLSVRRGRQRSRVEDSLQQLEAVGARCIGFVLNCAARRDINRYVSEQSMPWTEGQSTVIGSNAMLTAMRGGETSDQPVAVLAGEESSLR